MSFQEFVPGAYRRPRPVRQPDPEPAAAITPHCDQSVLHKPTECRHCDAHPDWQALRELWGIAFTGHPPAAGQVPCPSDQRRGTGAAHTWAGNRPTSGQIDVPPESFASKVMYGWHRGR